MRVKMRTCVCNPAALKAAEELHARSKGYSTSVHARRSCTLTHTLVYLCKYKSLGEDMTCKYPPPHMTCMYPPLHMHACILLLTSHWVRTQVATEGLSTA